MEFYSTELYLPVYYQLMTKLFVMFWSFGGGLA